MIITGALGGMKYHLNSMKIRKLQTAKGHSRMFINLGIIEYIARVSYAVVAHDFFVLMTGLIAFGFLMELMFYTYRYYPFHNRGLLHFKRPNFILYFINSWIPNRYAPKL